MAPHPTLISTTVISHSPCLKVHSTLISLAVHTTLSHKSFSLQMTIPYQLWSHNLPSSVKPSTRPLRVPLLALIPFNLGVAKYVLYLASGSYLRAIDCIIAHPFPLNKTSRWISSILARDPT